MGDMKTPDFDDLLAAFDIPDPDLDAKEAIQSSSEEAESHLKQGGMGIDELSMHHPIPDVPVVSVIVKNTSRQDSFDSITEKDGHQLGHNLLQNGFRNSDIASDTHSIGNSYSKMVTAFINGDSSRSYSDKFDTPRSEALPAFSQFSPISSPEPEETIQDAHVVDSIKRDERPYLGSVDLYVSTANSLMDRTRERPEQAVTELSMFDEYSKKREKANEIRNCNMKDASLGQRTNSINLSEGAEKNDKDFDKSSSLFDSLQPSSDLHNNNIEEPKSSSVPEMSLCSSVPPRQRLKSDHSKLSSCLAALVALNAKKTSEFPKEEQKENFKESLLALKDGIKGSPKMAKSPKSPRSPMEGVKKIINKQPDSPRSVSSDYSGKGSPYVATGSPPAIPKVRIKTIKTSSGEITRTVTRIMPDSEQSESRSSPEQSLTEMAFAEELNLRSSPVTISSSQTHTSTTVENGRKQMSARNMANAVSSLAGIPVKGHDDIDDNSNSKAIAVTNVLAEDAHSVTMKVAGTAQHKQAASKHSSNISSTSLLPKAVHLASLNLVPHSVAATATAKSSTLRQSQQKIATQVVTVPLVQQVKNTVPQHNESPTSNQNIVVEAFNKLLNSTNPVPIYAPNLKPPANSNVTMPARGYRCLECGDAFALEKSLSQHYERRSVHIEVMCSHCSKMMVFFNKCSLLLHAREHKGKGAVMQCTQLQMKPIPSDQMFSTTPVTSSVPSGPPAQAATSAQTVGSLTVIGVDNPPFTHPAMPLRCDSLRLIRHGLKCLECYQQFQDYNNLAGHYQQVTDDADAPSCRVCQMMLPNKCSYAAHLRIHAHKSPYCCPECGAVCRSADFQTHIKERCLHYARTVVYRCVHCGIIFSDSNTLKSHLQGTHCEFFHKCTICPMAFKSSQSASSHYSSQHPLVKHWQSEVILKCSMCETVFNQRALLHKHLEQHKNKLRVCVYKCPVCKLLYMHKQLMMEHFKDVHNNAQTTDKPPSPLSPSKDTSSDQKASTVQAAANGVISNSLNNDKKDEATVEKSETRPKVRRPGWTCAECLQWFPERELYVSHMKRSHGKSMKRYPCRQCDRSFNSSLSLRRHIRVNHDGVKRTYTCWYCTDEKHFFAKRFMLEKHINLMHGIKNPDFNQMPKAVHMCTDTTVEDLPGKRMASDSEVGELANSDILASLPKKLKVTVFKQYRCSICGYMTKSEADFQQHIPQHKSDGSTFQCSQCGLCYTSPLSLNRHLYIVHKLKEPEKVHAADVVRENGQDEHNRESNTTSEEDIDLQCQVCKDVFDSEMALSAHVRTHGMRFILSKQNGGSEQ
ncbi:zinc finger protein 592 isoform X1 [Hemiscyllium ocellatum]|uniref:zinc finger protein 592 isoform X1 n=1 Tax=Hemiscyllium ocellatum TaxID=170820 RepID=UPI0029665BF8|nr:zinc finger protein 592 isoform X1 [Hemiscyllium ocellatum]XP_060709593.1 zinc finger protein 592 isoform X1 [Hemiscyllium ocellatum]XP_060709594.1 zinc finger protein 592 isoform X1 [Hemiscyllium ocellatum]